MLSFLELVELSNGDIALRNNDDNNKEPMVVIRFSDATRQYLGDSVTDIARAMVQAGVEAAAELQEPALEPEEQEEVPRTIH